jgi:hypothetical protein
VEIHRPPRCRPDRRRAHPSDRSQHRLGCRAGEHVQGQPRARHFQDDRRRRHVAQGALHLRLGRRDGRRAAAGQSQRGVRVDVAPPAQAVDDHQRRTGESTSRRSPRACRPI